MQILFFAKADKGDTVVVMGEDHHYGQASKHLPDLSTYELLEMDPFKQIASDYHGFLDHFVMDKVFNKHQYRSLRVQTTIRCKPFISCQKYINAHLS